MNASRFHDGDKSRHPGIGCSSCLQAPTIAFSGTNLAFAGRALFHIANELQNLALRAVPKRSSRGITRRGA